MPPIDPKELLNALGPLLTNDGGIKGAKEASRVIKLMTNATKLVNRCIYLNILRVTSSSESLEQFMSLGGWDILNNWLDSARNTSNDPLIGELLEVYLNLPVTVVLLKQNSTAKTIKQLRKADGEKIQKLSAKLVDRWTKIIRDQNSIDDSEEKRKKKKQKEREKEKEKDKDKDKSEKERDKDRAEKDKERDRKDKDRDSEKTRDKDRDSKYSHSDRDKKDKNRPRDKEKEKDRQRDRRHSSSSSNSKADGKADSKESSSAKKHATSDSYSISKNTSNSATKTPPNLDLPSSNYSAADPDSSNATQAVIDQKKEEESRRRPKTVKMYSGKFRSLGLSDDEGDNDVEPIKKKTLEKAATLKRVIPIAERSEDMMSEKKPRLHITMPPLHSTTNPDGSLASTTPPEVTHGRIKIIPPKRAPSHEIQESNVFMDALKQSSSYTYGAFKRKKKLTSPSAGNPNAPLNLLASTIASGSSPPSAISPPITIQSQEMQATSPPLLSPTTDMAQRLPSVPSFYRDTLDDLPENSDTAKTDDRKDEEEEDDSSPPVLESMDIEVKAQDNNEEMETTEENEWGLGSAVPPKIDDQMLTEETSVISERSAKKKSVKWAADAQLEQIFFFEMDETERENVNRPKSFHQMKKEESTMDRRQMDAAKRFVNDNMVEVLQWKIPKLIDNVIVAVDPGCNSKESEIQMEREKGVLCALFFNKVPDTPIEPDPDIPGEQEDTKLIPLEDENGSCTEYEHTYNQNDPSSLPYDPEFDLPAPNQVPGGPPGMVPGPVPAIMGGNNFMSNGGGMKTVGMNLPPAINHLMQTLQQQAQETRDPLMANLQTMLSNVLQNTNPQDVNLLMDRVLNTLEQFRHQIPGLHNLINSITNGNVDNMSMAGGPRPFINQSGPPGPMGAPRHGLLGSHPPGFSMMGGGAGGGGVGMRQPHPPPMQGPGGPPMMGGGGGGGGNPNYYMGKKSGPGGGQGSNMEKMRIGGPPPGQWRGGGRRSFGKRGRSQICQHFINKGCKFGDSCGFIHPANSS